MRSPNTLKRTADAAVPVPRRREYVARVLVQYIPEMDQAGAYVVMQKAHKAGMAVVGVWVFEIAEAYCDGLKTNGLIASVTEESD